MDIHRREFLHSAGALALLATTGASALVAAGAPAKSLSWHNWPAKSEIGQPAFAAFQRYPGARYVATHRSIRGPVSGVVRIYSREPALLPKA